MLDHIVFSCTSHSRRDALNNPQCKDRLEMTIHSVVAPTGAVKPCDIAQLVGVRVVAGPLNAGACADAYQSCLRQIHWLSFFVLGLLCSWHVSISSAGWIPHSLELTGAGQLPNTCQHGIKVAGLITVSHQLLGLF